MDGGVVYVFGNQDIPEDSLPLRILPKLQKSFPNIRFEQKDPNEEWDVPERLIVIDTVVGIKKVTIFNDIKEFAAAPRITCHDFDALANLLLLHKIGRLTEVKIIGIPPDAQMDEMFEKVAALLAQLPD